MSVPSAYDFVGKVAFQRSFQVPQDIVDKYRFQLIALGVSQSAEITINNDFITGHTGGYSSIFQAVPTNTVQANQDNIIRVVVSNQLDYRKSFPLRPLGWMPRNYGGIFRDIYLLGTPRNYVRFATVRTEYNAQTGGAHVKVHAVIERDDKPDAQPGPLGLSIEIIDKISGITVGQSPVQVISGNEVSVDVPVQNPKTWSPDTPDLYLLRCKLSHLEGKEATLVDEYDVDCGIRQVSLENGKIFLNGKRLILKGVSWNEQHPTFGNALTYEQMEKDIAQIKTLGANVVRFIHHPPHPYMLDLCDRYGLFALLEIPVVSVPGSILDDDAFLESAGNVLRETISRDQNHASVLAYGLGDGIDVSQPSSRTAVERLAGIARAVDPRPLYIATPVVQGDVCTDLLDIGAAAIPPMDAKDFRSVLEKWRAMHPGKPLIVAQVGTEVQQENRRGYNDPYSQEAQARFYLQRFDILKSLDYDGGIIWAYNDWLGARPSLTVHSGNPWLHSLGLVSADREKRLAFDAVRATFHGEKFTALPIGTYSSKAPIIFVLVGFVGLVGMAYAYNASRRFRENLNRSLLNAFNFFSDIRDAQTVSFGHTLLLGIGVSVGVALVLSSILYHYRDSWFVDNLLSFLLVSDSVKAAFVPVVWNPLVCIGFIAGAVFLGLFVLSAMVYLIRVFFRQRIYAFHALTVTFWSAAPFLVFIPIGMVVYRAMESPMYVVPMLLLVLAVHLWVILRILKGLSIVFDVFPPKMYAVGFLTIMFAAAVLYLYYDAAFSAPVYIRFMYHLVTNTL